MPEIKETSPNFGISIGGTLLKILRRPIFPKIFKWHHRMPKPSPIDPINRAGSIGEGFIAIRSHLLAFSKYKKNSRLEISIPENPKIYSAILE